MIRVLFICSGNSCRSILAEALLNHLGQGKFMGYSAGMFPNGYVVPMVLDTLQQHGVSTEGLESKSVEAVEGVSLDLVITVCNRAAQEPCPAYITKVPHGHWDIPDPSHIEGNDAMRRDACDSVFLQLKGYIEALMALPFDQLLRPSLEAKVSAIATR